MIPLPRPLNSNLPIDQVNYQVTLQSPEIRLFYASAPAA
ncbi:hypothetical protein PPRY_a1536 [Pseudoalteromonas prydzensis ACAM 620]|nr:hypothetical protein [Pseudoalteromonas prydzensis ACAM 620]